MFSKGEEGFFEEIGFGISVYRDMVNIFYLNMRLF